jgi:hypothetical protein
MSAAYLTDGRLAELERQLGARDLDVLARVSALRFVAGAQLARLCFADVTEPTARARAARRALLRLTRLGILARLPRTIGGRRAGSAGFVFRLGHVGQRLAVRRALLPERRWRRSYEPGMLFVKHTLAVAELHVELVEADRSRRIELQELSAEPSCHRTYDGFGGQAQTLKPDSYVRFVRGDYVYAVFLEIDRGTEGSRALASQLDRYAGYWASHTEQATHGFFPRVLWLAPDDARVAVIEGCVLAQPRSAQALFEVARLDQAINAITGFTGPGS